MDPQRFRMVNIRNCLLWSMQGRNLEEVTVGHLQRALISYLETLSVTQLDRQESSLTWMAYVSLNRHAFMYAAPLVHCHSVTPDYTALALLFLLF